MKIQTVLHNTPAFSREIHTEIHASSAIFIYFNYIIISKLIFNIFAKVSAVSKLNYNTLISFGMQFCRFYIIF